MRKVQVSSALLIALLVSAGTTAAAGKKPKPAVIAKPAETSVKQAESSPQPAVIRKPSVDVRGSADMASPAIATLKRDAALTVTGGALLLAKNCAIMWLRKALKPTNPPTSSATQNSSVPGWMNESISADLRGTP